MNLEKWSALVTIIGLPLLLVSLVFAYILDGRINEQLLEIKDIAASQNNIALNTMVFNDPTNIGIIAAIEKNQKVLTKHGGNFSNTQLDKYLGDFDTVYFVYHEQLLTEDQLCDSFSAYIEETASSSEVNSYIKQYGPYLGFQNLLAIIKTSQDKYCSDNFYGA
jgi:hypothetical protein